MQTYIAQVGTYGNDNRPQDMRVGVVCPRTALGPRGQAGAPLTYDLLKHSLLLLYTRMRTCTSRQPAIYTPFW